MSLIIKGVDMPEYCEACPCYDWKEDICRITESPNDFSDTRISDCPLVEIPTPHGRLIDADELLLRIQNSGNFLSPAILAFIETAETIIDKEK